MKLTLLCVVALLAGCKKDSTKDKDIDKDVPGAGLVASCLSESVHSCREYRDANLALGIDSMQKLCTVVDPAAKYTHTPCPTSKLIATCTKLEGKDFFYDGYFEAAAKLEESCKQSGGTFATK